MNIAADNEFESLHPNARWTARMFALLLALPISIAPTIAATVLASVRLGFERSGLLLLLLPLLWVIASALAWWYAGRRFKCTRFRLDGDGLDIHTGVWWRRQTRVLRRRVQHTDINRGPLDRRLGLATLKVYTAGTRLASIELDGLPAERALQLRDALLRDQADAL